MSKQKSLLAFTHEQFGGIRGLLVDGEPWFVGKDVAVALQYADTFGALKKHVPKKHKKVLSAKSYQQMASNQETAETTSPFSDTSMGRVQRLTFIDEAGLYKLVFRSNLPVAESFSDWVCEEVLPSIRQTGNYTMSKKDEVREHGKSAGRRPLTDAIQLFEQRDNPKYYALPTRFIQSDLCGIPKGGRDDATVEQLVMLTLLEGASANVLKKAVDQGKSYQDAMFDMAKTTTFLKRVSQGEIPLVC